MALVAAVDEGPKQMRVESDVRLSKVNEGVAVIERWPNRARAHTGKWVKGKKTVRNRMANEPRMVFVL